MPDVPAGADGARGRDRGGSPRAGEPACVAARPLRRSRRDGGGGTRARGRRRRGGAPGRRVFSRACVESRRARLRRRFGAAAAMPSVEEVAEFVRRCRDEASLQGDRRTPSRLSDRGEGARLPQRPRRGGLRRRGGRAARGPGAFELDAESFRWRDRAATPASSPTSRDRSSTRSAAARSSSRSASSRSSGFCDGVRRRGKGLLWRDGDEAVDLSGLGDVFAQPTLNPLMAAGRRAWQQAIEAAQSHDGPRLRPEPAPPVRGRRLRRLLLLARARDEPRPDVPARSGAAPPELAVAAGRLPRPRRQRRRQRHRRCPAERPAEGARRGRADVRPEPPPRLRARARLRRRRRERARRAGAGRRVRRPRLRRRPRQRLERARHPGVGVRAARPVPRQVVPDLRSRPG